MELQRGTCVLCLDHNKVITPSDSQEFIDLIPQIISGAFLNKSEFQKIKDSLKICSICCSKLTVVHTTRQEIDRTGRRSQSDDDNHLCYFCKRDNNLVRVECDWKYFHDRTEGLYDLSNWKIVCACLSCLFYLDTAFNIRNKLFLKYPQVRIQGSPSSKRPNSTPKSDRNAQNDTPKRRSTSGTPLGSRKAKIFKSCFSYLQPLSSDVYRVDKELRSDARLYSKIAYVNLTRETLKPTRQNQKQERPKIKIKLKTPKNKKLMMVVNNKSDSSTPHKHGIKRRAYVDLSDAKARSEEAPPKVPRKRGRRRHSDSLKEREENGDETPKASAANNAPKRRASVFVESGQDEPAEAPQTDAEDSSLGEPAKDAASTEESAKDDASTEEPTVDDASTGEPAEDVTSTEEPAEDVASTEEPSEDVASSEGPAEDVTSAEESGENLDKILEEINGDSAIESQTEQEGEAEEDAAEAAPDADSEERSDDVDTENSSEAENASEVENGRESPQDLVAKIFGKDPSFAYHELDAKAASENGSDRDSSAGAEKKKKRVTFIDDIQ